MLFAGDRAFLALALIIGSVLAAPAAFSDTVSAVGGLGFGRNSGMNQLQNPGPLLGVEYSLDLPSPIHPGGFYNYDFITNSDGHSGSIQFMGLVLRYEPGDQKSFSPFVDGKLGMGKRTELEQDSGLKLGYGAGVGVRIPITQVTSLSPRFDLQYVPDAAASGAGHQALLDFGLMVSFKL